LIELTGSSEVKNQYFTPLSEYIAQPNPFNKGTEFEDASWKDTYVDGMNSALDPSYSEYFGVGTYFHVYRLFVNLDLLEKATGSKKMPKTLDQWLDSCAKLKAYGKKIGKPIIPIGVRGFDKSTIYSMFRYYYRQLNGNLQNKPYPIYASTNIPQAVVFKAVAEGYVEKDRLLAAVDILRQLGQNFGKGFTATDLEQTKFLFFTGNVGYFPEGTWNAYSMVKNSPFDVGIIKVPAIGPDSKYYKYFTGVPGEQVHSGAGQFGIPKASKNFDLALEFLQYITSWKVSQRVMIDYCKWPCAVKKSKYKGIMKHFEPIPGKGSLWMYMPFWTGSRTRSQTRAVDTLESIILQNTPDCKEYFWNLFLEQNQTMQNELKENQIGSIRKFASMESLRAGLQVQDLGASPKQKKALLKRQAMTFESEVYNLKQMDLNNMSIKALKQINEKEGDGE
jgi:ABC-type glycerol-3-phosphate transport system substrate-binding protein